MSNKILLNILIVSVFLTASLFLMYRGYNWPLGTEGIQALGGIGILFITLLSYFFVQRKISKNTLFISSITFGLYVGLLWTVEISMNNLLYPPLSQRDMYDDIFWAIVAVLILGYCIYYAAKLKKMSAGIIAGLWSGFASGAVACLTALTYIVVGMNFVIHDPLNIAEWSQRGGTSGSQNISVYFAYQTLAGALMHLIILGVIMGVLLGVIGGLFGKIISPVTTDLQAR